jgi:hypothetical protein
MIELAERTHTVDPSLQGGGHTYAQTDNERIVLAGLSIGEPLKAPR